MSIVTSAELRRRAHFQQLDAANAPRGQIARWFYTRRRLIAWAILWLPMAIIGIWMPTVPFTFLLLAILTVLGGSGQLPGSRWGA